MKVAVLGTGQLGAMLQHAGAPLGIDVHLLNVDKDQLPDADTPITAEREHWPENAFTHALQQHPSWLNRIAFSALPNRSQQKVLLDQLGLPTSPWCLVTSDLSQEYLHQKLGPDVFLKRASGGYDGRGQKRLKEGCANDFPDWAWGAIAEQAVPFETEVSIIGARGHDGQTVYYRLTENRHQDGILTISLSQPGRFEKLQSKAEQMLGQVMQHLNYVGVMAMECFVVNGQLLINEIAPRVHNSGHWTQAGASLSQFELHLRAVCGLPLPEPEQPGYSVMINLLGVPFNTAWLKHGAAQLHWYGKSVQPGRKMGHINLYHPNPSKLAEWLNSIEIPTMLESSRKWAISTLLKEA